jgi:predicted ester cyclase
MMMMTPEELLERYYYKGLNKGDSGEAVLRELVDENVKFRGVFGHRSKKGLPALLEYGRATRLALGTYTFEIDDMVVAKDNSKASVRITCRGQQRGVFFGVQEGSGHEVKFTAAAFFKFSQNTDDDKLRIIDIFSVGDLDEIKRQIGATSECGASAFPPVPRSITTTTTSADNSSIAS